MDWKPYLDKNGKLSSQRSRKIVDSSEYKILINRYPWCKSPGEIYYCYKNNITEQPKCYCGSNIKHFNSTLGYANGCSKDCQEAKLVRQRKVRETLFNNHGIINISQKHLSEETRKLMYDVNWLTYQHHDLGKTINEIAQELKINSTNLGVIFKNNNIKVILNIGQRIERYQNTLLKQCNIINISQKHLSEETRKLMYDINWLTYQHHILEKPVNKIANELKINAKNLCDIFRKLNIEIKRFKHSQGEKELYEYIKTITSKIVILNDRTLLNPYELDIYIPDLKLAFEFDGEFWHRNSRGRDRWKTFRCKELGITLYHIHENIWKTNRNKINQSILKILSK